MLFLQACNRFNTLSHTLVLRVAFLPVLELKIETEVFYHASTTLKKIATYFLTVKNYKNW